LDCRCGALKVLMLNNNVREEFCGIKQLTKKKKKKKEKKRKKEERKNTKKEKRKFPLIYDKNGEFRSTR
jgi:selenocysteine-specific translation elongation factor